MTRQAADPQGAPGGEQALVTVYDHHRLPLLVQAPDQMAADGAGPDHHDMAPQGALDGGLFRLRLRVAPQPALGLIEHQRVEHDGETGPDQYQVARHIGHQPQQAAQPHQDEGELPHLRQTGRDGEGGASAVAKQPHYDEGRHRLADDDDEDGRQHRQRLAQQDGGIKQHAHRHEEEHGEGILQWQGVVGRLVAQVRAVHHDAGEEGAEGEGDPEQLDGAKGDAE
ncbi:hypothetical protein D3C71_1418530 [compost metagenome]